MSKLARTGIFFIFLLVSALSCYASSVSDRIAAVVNDDVILESEIRKYKLPFVRDIISLPLGIVPPGKWPTEKEILEELIVIHLLEQEAAKRGMKIDERGIDASLESIRKRNNLTQDQFVLYLNSKGINYSEYRKLMKRQFSLTRLIASEVTQKIPFAEEDVVQYYKKNKARIDEEYGKLVESHSPAQPAKEPEKIEIPTHEDIYIGGKIRLKQITLKIPGNRQPKDVEKMMEKARTIFKDVVYNGADFSELAKRNSNDPLASKGGDLGTMNYNDMVPQMQKLVQRMKEGDVTPPLKTPEAVIMFHLAEAKNRTQKKVPIPEKIRKEMEKQVKEEYDRRAAQRKRALESSKAGDDHAEDAEKPKIPPGMLTPEEEKDYLKARRKAMDVVRNEKVQSRMKDWIGELKKNSIIEVKI